MFALLFSNNFQPTLEKEKGMTFRRQRRKGLLTMQCFLIPHSDLWLKSQFSTRHANGFSASISSSEPTDSSSASPSISLTSSANLGGGEMTSDLRKGKGWWVFLWIFYNRISSRNSQFNAKSYGSVGHQFLDGLKFKGTVSTRASPNTMSSTLVVLHRPCG